MPVFISIHNNISNTHIKDLEALSHRWELKRYLSGFFVRNFLKEVSDTFKNF